MFRAFALVLTLSIAAGPTAGLLCHVLCAHWATDSMGCHEHEAGSTAVFSGLGDCDPLVGAVAGLPGTVRDVASPQDVGAAAMATVESSHMFLESHRTFDTPQKARRLDHRPLSTVLRI